ncbi:MAG: type II secretion system F family protein [Chloroflexi bacterium]|nr:type II secretion system F family protein [Chloroflexota bacterium]
MNLVFIITLFVTIAIFLVFAGLHRWLSASSEVQQRLMGANLQPGIELSNRNKLNAQVNKRLGRLSFAAQIERQLTMADSSWTVAEYLMLRLGCALGLFLLGWLFSGNVIGGLLLAIVGWSAPSFYIRHLQAKRSKNFGEQLPDMLNLLVGSLQAGYGLMYACNIVRQEMPEPIATEFGRVMKETSLGYTLDQAFGHMVERLQNDDLALVVAAINVQNEVGGSLAEILATISETIRERVKLKGEIRVLTAQQRMTGLILSLLPFGVGTLIMLINPGYMMPMFQPGWTLLLPAVATVMIIFGNITMQWVTKIEV